MDRNRLFYTYGISDDRLAKAGLSWDELEQIDADYGRLRGGLESVGGYVVDALLKCPTVHSIKYRLKESDHLLEKILRKREEDGDRIITVDNYRTEISDLVGIRALHLFKEDWQSVHGYINGTWELAERPVAYVRSGDSEKIIEFYKQNGCDVKEHRFGYRSVHYLISSSPDRERYLIEIQARTVFEEAWGEIDHVISYPYARDNELLVRLSSILNRLAANADELGSYMRYLKNRTDSMQNEYTRTISEKNQLIAELQKKIDRLEIDSTQKEALTSDLAALGQNKYNEVRVQEEYPWLDHLMESDLFQRLSQRIEKVMHSEEFGNMQFSEEDLKLLSNAQLDLLKMLNSPEDIKRVLESAPLPPHLKALEDQRDSSSDGDATGTSK